MSDVHLNHISTKDLITATGYIDGVVDQIREAHANGADLGVEEVTMMILAGVVAANLSEPHAIAQLAVLLAICLQRLS